MNPSRRRLSAALAGSIAAGLARPSFAQPAPPLRTVRMALDWALEGQQSPFVLAADGGHFARAGVEVRVDRGFGSGDTVVKLASGAYDVGFADLGAAIAFNARQGATKVINVFQVYDLAPLAIMTLRDSGIGAARDLAGRTIAAPPGDSSRVMFPVLARAAGLDPASVTWLDVAPQLRETMLAQRRAHAISAQVTSLLSFRPLRMEPEVRVLRYGDMGVDLYGHAILTTPDFARDQPEALRRVLAGVASAWRAAVADPAASAAALGRRDGLTDVALETDRLRLILDAAVATTASRTLGEVSPARMRRTVLAVSEAFGLSPLDLTPYSPEFLPPEADRRLAP